MNKVSPPSCSEPSRSNNDANVFKKGRLLGVDLKDIYISTSGQLSKFSIVRTLINGDKKFEELFITLLRNLTHKFLLLFSKFLTYIIFPRCSIYECVKWWGRELVKIYVYDIFNLIKSISLFSWNLKLLLTQRSRYKMRIWLETFFCLDCLIMNSSQDVIVILSPWTQEKKRSK